MRKQKVGTAQKLVASHKTASIFLSLAAVLEASFERTAVRSAELIYSPLLLVGHLDFDSY